MDFVDQIIADAHFERVDLSGAQFQNVDLSRARFRQVIFSHCVLKGVELGHVEIEGEVEDLTINGVDVVPLIDAELNRRDPDRARMRPANADGFRVAWEIIEGRWAATVERARTLSVEDLHVRVADEWSFIETLRHLVFATDAWVRRGILGEPSPWDPLDLPWDQMEDTPGVPRDRTARPSLDEVVALRRDRMTGVRELLRDMTDERLSQATVPVDGPGWPPPEPFTVRQCLLVVLNEEWEHRRFAERDLDVVTA